MTKNDFHDTLFLSNPDGRGDESRRGKSELRRAGCRVTPGGGDSKESATENYRHVYRGKDEKAR